MRREPFSTLIFARTRERTRSQCESRRVIEELALQRSTPDSEMFIAELQAAFQTDSELDQPAFGRSRTGQALRDRGLRGQAGAASDRRIAAGRRVKLDRGTILSTALK